MAEWGNLNPGLLLVRCLDIATGEPVEGARAILTWVEADASIGGRLRLYDEQGRPDNAPGVDSGASGVAALKFGWDPIQVANLVSHAPRVRVSVVGPAPKYKGRGAAPVNKLYFTERVGYERIYLALNFEQAWSGAKGMFNLSTAESGAQDAATKIKDIIQWSWEWKDAWIKAAAKGGSFFPVVPKALGNFGVRLSTEVFGLVGGFDVRLTRQT